MCSSTTNTTVSALVGHRLDLHARISLDEELTDAAQASMCPIMSATHALIIQTRRYLKYLDLR